MEERELVACRECGGRFPLDDTYQTPKGRLCSDCAERRADLIVMGRVRARLMDLINANYDKA